MSILIKKGRVVDPASGEEGIFDILIEGERIRKISGNIKVLAEEVIDAEGKVVIPGLVDMHVHARQPGREDEETLRSVTLAAARGGFTTICCMPNTTPVIDTPAVVEYIYREAEENALIEVLVIGAITAGCRGERLSEMGRLKKAGVVAFSDDGKWVVDSQVMRRALEYSKMLNLPVISHCEDTYLSRDGFVNEGYWSTVLGLAGIPSEAEEIAVFRDLALARLTGGKLHIAHVSCERAVKLIREAKREKIKVTCEVTPHHLALSDEVIRTFNTNTKVNPPLRRPKDIESLKMGLKDGTIDVIATDHAPHAREEKEMEYPEAPFGIIGLETALSLVFKELVEPGILTFKEVVAKFTLNPSAILGIERGKISEGHVANLAILDLSGKWEVKEEEFLSCSKNSPFIGWILPLKVELTLFKGRVVHREKERC